jgi:hypothetical protein
MVTDRGKLKYHWYRDTDGGKRGFIGIGILTRENKYHWCRDTDKGKLMYHWCRDTDRGN